MRAELKPGMTKVGSKKGRYAARHRRGKIFDMGRGDILPLLKDGSMKLSSSRRSGVKLHNATLKEAPNSFDWAHIWGAGRPRKNIV